MNHFNRYYMSSQSEFNILLHSNTFLLLLTVPLILSAMLTDIMKSYHSHLNPGELATLQTVQIPNSLEF